MSYQRRCDSAYYSTLSLRPRETLHDAVLKEDLPLIEELLSHGMSINIKPFLLAIRNQKVQSLRLLLKFRPRPLKELIRVAIACRNFELVDELLQSYEGDKTEFVCKCIRVDLRSAVVYFLKYVHDPKVLFQFLRCFYGLYICGECLWDFLSVTREEVTNATRSSGWFSKLNKELSFKEKVKTAWQLYQLDFTSLYFRRLPHQDKYVQYLMNNALTMRLAKLSFPLEVYYNLSEETRSSRYMYLILSCPVRPLCTHHTIFLLHHVAPKQTNRHKLQRISLILRDEELQLEVLRRLTKNASHDLRVCGDILLSHYRLHIRRFLK